MYVPSSADFNAPVPPKYRPGDVNPFLLVPAITHAENQSLITAKRQQCRAIRVAKNQRYKSGTSDLNIPAMLLRGQVVEIAASQRKRRDAFIPILEAIDVVTLDAMQHMKRPTAVMLRITLLQDESPSSVLKLLSESCMRRGQHERPNYVWVREIRPMCYDGLPGDYLHFHVLFVFDRKAIGCRTIKNALRNLEARGWLESWHISSDMQHGQQVVQHNLRDPNAAENYRHHVGYLAKVATKARVNGRRLFGRSQLRMPKQVSFTEVA